MEHPGIGAVRISSGSMRPVLEVGDTVLFYRRFVRVEPGDIVVFRTFVHRAVWVEGRSTIWEVGDANAQWPRPWPYDQVEGLAFMRVRDGRWMSLKTASLARTAEITGRAGARHMWASLRRSLGRG